MTRAAIGFKVPSYALYRPYYIARCGCNRLGEATCPSCGLSGEITSEPAKVAGFNGTKYQDFDVVPVPGGFVIGRVTNDSLPLMVEEFLFVYTRVRERLEAGNIYDGAVFGLFLSTEKS
jgi:hypothetical protein